MPAPVRSRRRIHRTPALIAGLVVGLAFAASMRPPAHSSDPDRRAG